MGSARFRNVAALTLVLGLAASITYAGFRVLWFLTDDAFITFRYASNAMAGRGYVWNPAPFRPVEGYTSPAWLVLLHGVWWLSGITPPDSSAWLGLGFGYITLGFVAVALLRARFLRSSSRGYRVTVLALVLLGTVTNRTFLTWLSSGLETSLFDCAIAGWIASMLLLGEAPSRLRAVAASAMAALVALARPDGLLHAGVTAALVAWLFRERRRDAVAGLSPLAVLVVHVLWRRSFYGEWLPNTYYAKLVAPWPAAGLRYVAAFVLEYGFWLWTAIAAIAVAITFRRIRAEARAHTPGDAPVLTAERAAVVAVVVVCVSHVAYYALVVGGDHFEYRVLCWAVPWLFVSFAWGATVLFSRTAILAALAAQVALSWPLAWIHFDLLRQHEERILRLFVPVAPAAPAPLAVPARLFDSLQKWLVDRMIAVSQQEHRVFLLDGIAFHPPRAEGAQIPWSARYVKAASSVGLVSWLFPNVAVIDDFGLNDWVVARNRRLRPDKVPQLAHERGPPPGYVECFRPNFRYTQFGYDIDPGPKLTDAEIRDCESRFAAIVTR